MVFINRVDRTPDPKQTERVKKATKKTEESFSDALESVFGVDAVQFEPSKEESEKYKEFDSNNPKKDFVDEDENGDKKSLLDIKA